MPLLRLQLHPLKKTPKQNTREQVAGVLQETLKAVRIHDQVVNRYDYALWKITRCFACGLRADAASLAAMAACVNEAHGKTVILSEEAATRENIIRLANFSYDSAPKNVISAGRHRGLTFWPWTYETMEARQAFAEDYLFGMSGLTTDYAWWTENLLEEIESKDITLRAGEALPKPLGRNKRNERFRLETAEAVKAEDLPDGTSLMLWRYKANLQLGDESFGSYYLYSEPFLLRTEPVSPDLPKTGDAGQPFLWLTLMLIGVSGLGTALMKRMRK